MALGRLLEKRTLSLKSYAVKALNFTDSATRGGDLKRSILDTEQFAKNTFSFQRKLMKLVGAKNDNDLNKKILDYEFNNPLMLLCALGAQFNRLEKRYILNGISIYEAFCRRVDFDRTLMAICNDLYQFGMNENILHYIHEFSSDLVDPKLDLNEIDEKNVKIDESQSNNNDNNNNKNINVNDDTNETFIFDGSELMYTNVSGVKILINLNSPILDLYNKNRSNFGAGDKKETWVDLFNKNEIPEFCENGACFKFNFGCDGCPFAEPCKIKTEPHIFTHYCALGGCKNTAIYNCKFLRCFMFLSKCYDNDWFKKTYSIKWERVYNPKMRRTTFPRSGRGARGSRGNQRNSSSYNNSYNYRNDDSDRNNYNNYKHQQNYDFRGYDDYDDQFHNQTSNYNNYDNRNKRNGDKKRGYNSNNGSNRGYNSNSSHNNNR